MIIFEMLARLRLFLHAFGWHDPVDTGMPRLRDPRKTVKTCSICGRRL